MHITINITPETTDRQLQKIQAAVAALRDPVATATDHQKILGGTVSRTVVGEIDATRLDSRSNSYEFGVQPLPAEATAGPLAPPAEALALCEVCAEPQFSTPSGVTCANGHGGADRLPLAPPAPPAVGAAPSTTAPEATTGSSAAPAAPPAPPAPPAAATQPPAPVGEVDKNGLPWDERIHSGNRAKVADGSWRMRRNVDPTKVAQVEAELRGQAQVSLAPPPPAANPMTIRTIPVTGGEPDAAPLPPAAPALTFGMVAKRVTAKLTLGELTTAELTKRLAELGFPDGLHTINSRPDMWLTVLETLGA